MKNIRANSRFRIFIAVAAIVFCGAAIPLFPIESVMSASNIEKTRIEKQGRLTIFRFDIKVSSTAPPIAVRVVVSREKIFRVDYNIAENFPHIDAKQLQIEKILWVTERQPPGKEYSEKSWAGLFFAFDGDYGHIQNLQRGYRVYKKYIDEYEIDYTFSADLFPRSELAAHIHEIDKQVFEVLKNSGAFSK